MATEQSSSESPSRKRPRRSKQDPQFIFDNPIVDETETDTSLTKRNSTKNKTKPLRSVDSPDASADLYEPGDIVWCKLGGFPWWPALIYRCTTEGGIHTKTLNSNNKPKRLFFVYFYGKYLEYSWISTRWLLTYAGLSNFIQHAEAAVQQAATKSEQQELANRFQLKVSMKKRVQWDEAIELADRALTMTKDERIEDFSDLLKDALNQTKNSVRRRKTSVEKNQNEEEGEGGEENGENKQHARDSSISSNSSLIPEVKTEETNTTEKPSVSHRKPAAFNQNGSTTLEEDDQTVKKKRGRKPKSETNTLSNSAISTTEDNQPMKTRTKISSTNKDHTPSTKQVRKSRRSEKTNGNEIEYDYKPSDRSDQQISSPIVHLLQGNYPPLSNFEQKQIVEGLLHHPKENSLTFDEAQTYAINKAIEIIYENHNYRMNNISPEWFYESILLKYPSVVFKYRSWFENIKTDTIPNGNDMIKLKQWQIGLMLQAQIKAEQQQQQQDSSNGN
ncbi:unnamed protein product [Adineta steineri]|uniref:PWWP domain-containing protein n=2 Tax=Adineta steineri TaxID=433720 RepID=A0A815IRX9_9BILA|nr:unnamed protein product [Adineta steineri]CAF1224090.1 unnamed protein product [Adineta steineri]CAF1367271.1 unnamed protein product [Adineta steineri]CAF1602707.1 unnamed protein product [Adineta steineri]